MSAQPVKDMRITIAQRYRPFSHVPGAFFVLPGSHLAFRIFPAMIQVNDLSGKSPRSVVEVEVNCRGPVSDFTVMHDLEKGCISVWGHTVDGYFRYRLTAIQWGVKEGFIITVEKDLPRGLHFSCSRGYQLHAIEKTKPTWIVAKSDANASDIVPFVTTVTERLALGNHKLQENYLLQRHMDMTAIMPLWFLLGQLIPEHVSTAHKGTMQLLDKCSTAIQEKSSTKIVELFRNLFVAGFSDGLVPRLHDEQFQGFDLSPFADRDEGSPLALLTEGSALIRRLFVQCDEGSDVRKIEVLPVLPPEFHAGRLLNAFCGTLGMLDLEWSKKTVRRMVFTANASMQVQFIFPRELRRVRLRSHSADRGIWIDCHAPLQVTAGSSYRFDRFEK